MPKTFTLSLAEIDIVDEDLRLGRWLYPYEIPYASSTFEERDRQRAEVWEGLHREKLAMRERLKSDVEQTLVAWAKPEILITQVACVLETDARYLYRGGWQRKIGFLSRQESDSLVFEQQRPEQVVPAMVDFLPSWPAFRGRGVTVTTPPARNRADDGVRVADAEPTRDNLGEGQRFFDYPLLRYGILTVSAEQRGNRAASLGKLMWFDSTEGRFMLEVEELADGAQRKIMTPTGGGHIRSWLYDKINEASQR